MLTFRLALDEQTSRSEANAHGRHDVTRCAHKAVSTRQAGCEKPIVEQIGGVERKAPTVPVNLGKRIYRPEERRVWTEGVRTCIYRWSQNHEKTNKKIRDRNEDKI